MAMSASTRAKSATIGLKPPQEIPSIPTLPLDQGWRASQAMTRSPSSCSCAEYSRVVGAPPLMPTHFAFDGDRTTTFAQYRELCERAAAGLYALGVTGTGTTTKP